MRASLLTRAGSVAAAAVIATTGAMAVAGAADASTAPCRGCPPICRRVEVPRSSIANT